MIVLPIQFDGKHIEWSHLVKLYHKCQPNVTSPGLTILPKLEYEHISLTRCKLIWEHRYRFPFSPSP